MYVRAIETMPERTEINVIPDNLRHEETIVRIAEALDNLGSAVNYIFESIDKRLFENGQRLSNVKNRATKVQDRLKYLQTNLNLKAVKMYSAARYPASHTYKEYQMAIPPRCDDVNKIPKVYKCSVPIKDVPETYLSSNCKTEDGQYVANNNLQEKLQFYHVRSKSNKETYAENNDAQFPLNLSSINAILFNSMDNPYKTPSHSTKQTSRKLNDKEQIEDAPDSIVQPWLSSEIDPSSSYFYTPTLGEVPQINVPPTLPDLPGIVDDEKFILDLNSQSPIAPSSAVTTPTVRLDLPTPTSTTDEKDVGAKPEQTIPNLPGFADNDFPKDSTEPAPPPPPLPPLISPNTVASPASASSATETDSSLAPSSLAPSMPPPPPPPPPPPAPPPPPPPAPPESNDTETKTTETKKPIGVPKGMDQSVDRSTLMEAIRNAGGVGRAKLRRTVLTDERGNRWSSASVGGDLMADLHAKLALRRKGIAGSSSSALERMSSLIPPPPKPSEATASDRNSATSDSQPDTDDWDE